MTITEAGIKSGSILIYATHPSPDLPKSEESFGNLQQNYFKAVLRTTSEVSIGWTSSGKASLELSVGWISS